MKVTPKLLRKVSIRLVKWLDECGYDAPMESTMFSQLQDILVEEMDNRSAEFRTATFGGVEQ